eukprot:3833986-Amphidinium_carterae.1
MASSSHDAVTAFAGERSFSASGLMQLMPASEEEEGKIEGEGDETQTIEEDCCLLTYCVRIETVGRHFAPSLISSGVYECCVDVDASQDKGSKSSNAWYDLAAGIAKAKRLMTTAVNDVESTLMGLVEQTKET